MSLLRLPYSMARSSRLVPFSRRIKSKPEGRPTYSLLVMNSKTLGSLVSKELLIVQDVFEDVSLSTAKH
jgi:hypothetical protein